MRSLRMVHLALVVALLFAANARAEESDEESPDAEQRDDDAEKPELADEHLPDKPLAEHVQLEYTLWPRTDSCPSERALRHALLTRMKVDPFSRKAKAKLRVVMQRIGPWFQGSYDILDSDGRVVMPHIMARRRECANSMADVALSVGLWLPLLITDPIAKPAPVCSAEKAPEPVCSSPPVKAPPSLPPTKLAQPMDIWVGGGPLVSYLISPSLPALGVSGYLGAQWPWLSVSLGVRAEHTTKNGPDAAQVSAWRVAGEVAPCYRFPPESSVFLCGVLQVGYLNVDYLSSDGPRSDKWPNWALGARFGTLQPFSASRWGGYVFGQFDVPIGPSHFSGKNGTYDLHATAGLTGMAGLIYFWPKK